MKARFETKASQRSPLLQPLGPPQLAFFHSHWAMPPTLTGQRPTSVTTSSLRTFLPRRLLIDCFSGPVSEHCYSWIFFRLGLPHPVAGLPCTRASCRALHWDRGLAEKGAATKRRTQRWGRYATNRTSRPIRTQCTHPEDAAAPWASCRQRSCTSLIASYSAFLPHTGALELNHSCRKRDILHAVGKRGRKVLGMMLPFMHKAGLLANPARTLRGSAHLMLAQPQWNNGITAPQMTAICATYTFGFACTLLHAALTGHAKVSHSSTARHT